ncbi:MAG: GNAT family N-acetyltransferase [Alphaproteobacteria bacterium]|nr:GNAT family N-acetyltransferase [Alphaproteobacteria bacterium]
MSLAIRNATPSDAGLICELVQALAAYEKLAHEATAGSQDFEKALSEGHARAIIAEWEGEPCGFALYFFNFSTFLGRRGVYLEDLFVKESHRGKGVGKALLSKLARIAVENDCARLDWAVLDWNAPSIAFYKSLGAKPMDAWITYRLTGAPLAALAKGAR